MSGRYGPQFGPDITFLGVDRCTLGEPETYAGADVVILGAPFDGGTSHRPGTRFGPQAIRMTDYLPHDGSRPSLALRVDGLQDLRVVDAGDVEIDRPVIAVDLRDFHSSAMSTFYATKSLHQGIFFWGSCTTNQGGVFLLSKKSCCKKQQLFQYA